MAIYRSEYFYKDKSWFSDFKVDKQDENTEENRMKFDIKRFMAHTGLVKTVVENMFTEACRSGVHRRQWKDKFGWTMNDLGKVENQ